MSIQVGFAESRVMDTKTSEILREQIVLHGKDGNTIAADLYSAQHCGSKGTVILAHGGGQTRHSWRSTAQSLAECDWRAVSVDMRGHGDSAWAEDGSYQFDDFAGDLASIAEELSARSGDKPYVVGASLGGISAMLSEGEPEGSIFSGIVLVDVTPRMRHDGVEKIYGFMSENADQGFETLQEASDAIAAYLPNRKRPAELSGLAKNLRLGSDNRYRWHWDPRLLNPKNRRAKGNHREKTYQRLEQAVRRIKVPLMLVRGRQSELVDEELAVEFMKLAPHAEYVDVSEAGHMVAGDKNDVFTDAVVNFLNCR